MMRDIQIFVGDRWIDLAERDTEPVSDPSTGRDCARYSVATADDLDAALNAVDRAFPIWSGTDAATRSVQLRAVARLIEDRSEEIARLIAEEQGKPITQARIEVAGGVEMFDWFAEEARRTYGRVIPSPDPSIDLKVVLEPVGPSVIFTPWNFPFAEAATHLSAALAAGCPAIVKAPHDAPGPGEALIRAVVDSGLPNGVVQFVLGPSAPISDQLIGSPIIRKIGFTGSTPVGKQLAAKAAAEMKTYTMELGGDAPVLIFEDFDPEEAARRLAPRKLRNTGQVCTAPNRFLVHESIHDRFVAAYAAELSAAKIGPALDESSLMGPVVNEKRVRAMEAFCADAIAKGAKIAHGGTRIGEQGCFWDSTIITNVPDNANVAREEIFGPVSPVFRFSDIDGAIAWANDTAVGLSSYVFTRDIDIARTVAAQIKTGTVSINHGVAQFVEAPFGGVKDTGQGRVGSIEGLNAYLTTKTVSTRFG